MQKNNKFKHIKNIALSLAATQQSPPISLISIAEKLNTEIHFVELPDKIAGAVFFINDPVVIVNKAHCATRQRFTIAHEIGHIALEHNTNKVMAFTMSDFLYAGQTIAKEKEANLFAAELLIPTPLLMEKIYGDGVRCITHLSKVFHVSEQVMAIKLKNLSIKL